MSVDLQKAIEELDRRKRQMDHLNAELFDTNRGVLALYAELDDKAETLRRADELKTRFLSNMSHEFRTPLNSILALSRLLTDQVDGTLSSEQHKQVSYIRKSATELLDLVNDLLDLAKVESGKVTLRNAEFSIENLFAALRGMLRPMLTSDSVELIFEDAREVPALYSDEAKVTQILRNFLANAIKFTRAWGDPGQRQWSVTGRKSPKARSGLRARQRGDVRVGHGYRHRTGGPRAHI